MKRFHNRDEDNNRERNLKFYKSKQWQLFRNAILNRDNYCCKSCERNFIIKPATQVHHIIEINKDWNKRFDPDNCEAICDECHIQETLKEINKRKKEKNKIDQSMFDID